MQGAALRTHGEGAAAVNSGESANEARYWPACMSEPGFMPWFSRLCLLASNTDALAAHHLAQPPAAWVDAARLLLSADHNVDAGHVG